ncbi:MAG: tRNA (adenosine(37)-N6)-threonylcarbamoyltransferase complex transferase subunit TsaD [Spirochaetales bacterium]|nr:tRNA (adenosine(37)-N6)-threonylcarbamoyltransferase complex transferase subunit TsaD [Spirochaetales bacterium]
MYVLGIESSCDECAASVVEDGKKIFSNIVSTQIEIHHPYHGVVPEIASRTHTIWIAQVIEEALETAGIEPAAIDAVAVTSRPGLLGSLLVGLSFAKAWAWALGKPLVGIDHIKAHLYAAHLERDIEYPYIGLLVSGGHSIICLVEDFDTIKVMGTTIDDACGEAFDKIAKYFNLGYPGGVIIDKMSAQGNPDAYRFPDPSLHKGDHRYDVSYSGLKTAVINQLDQFRVDEKSESVYDIVASFQKTAIDMLLKRVKLALADTGLTRLVAGGGVAANSYLRKKMQEMEGIDVIYPSLKLCTDNGAMIAGIGYHYLKSGQLAGLDLNASARVEGFRKTYP